MPFFKRLTPDPLLIARTARSPDATITSFPLSFATAVILPPIPLPSIERIRRSVADTIKKLIDKNEKVCIFPQHIKEKDINDMVLNGMNVHDIIEDNTHSGPSAMLAYTSWRKCK